MRFILKDEILNGDDSVLRHLEQVVTRAEDEIHRIEIDAAGLKQTKFYEGARMSRKQFLLKAASSPPQNRSEGRIHSATHMVDNDQAAAWAAKLAYAPLVILVEDREADGVLVEILINTSPDLELRALWDRCTAITPLGLQIETSGGIGSMPQRVARFIDDCNAAERPVRLLVLCDSDKRWPDDDAHGSVGPIGIIEGLCRENGITFHVLRKRNAENYIPDSILRADLKNRELTTRHPQIEALLRRSIVQRDHFPLKDALSPADRDEALRENLYDNSELDDLKLLEKRVFLKRPRVMMQLWPSRRSEFSATDMSERDGIGEIEVILSFIREAL